MSENIFVLLRGTKNATITEWSELTGLSVEQILSLEEGRKTASYNTMEIYSRFSGISIDAISHFNKKNFTWFEKGMLKLLKGINNIGPKVEKKEDFKMEYVKLFVGVDPQVDFIDGALPNEIAKANVAYLNASADDARMHDFIVAWTKDTHAKCKEDYLKTLEGQNLPIYHCGEDTDGWQFHPEIKLGPSDLIFMKPTFGSISLAKYIWNLCIKKSAKCVIMGGYCTDICGISNALLIRAVLPNVPIYWLSFASAGVTVEKHNAALEVMESCQITVIHNYDDYLDVLKKYD